MINFDLMDSMVPELSRQFSGAGIMPFVAIDNFCNAEALERILSGMPDPEKEKVNKSRDYFFAKNKFEKSSFRHHGADFEELYQDFVSERFQKQLQLISGENVFIDKTFHGGGMHQGGEGSFLDMHADFNYHPIRGNWFRNLNILLYLNKDWKPEYGGQLKLKNRITDKMIEIEPFFNRCVIMLTRDYTLHGYDPISFPKGQYRRSIAAYAYTEIEEPVDRARSTTWYPEKGGVLKRAIGRHWPKLVKVKNSIFGSSTEKNR